MAFRKSATTNEIREPYLPEKAVDGSTQNSHWNYCFVSANANKVWFDVNFEALVTITHIQFVKYNDGKYIVYTYMYLLLQS